MTRPVRVEACPEPARDAGGAVDVLGPCPGPAVPEEPGAVVVALYAALYVEEGLVNELFTRGGAYAVLPILTAFVFSFAHGNFTGNFWSSLGVEASKARKEVK